MAQISNKTIRSNTPMELLGVQEIVVFLVCLALCHVDNEIANVRPFGIVAERMALLQVPRAMFLNRPSVGESTVYVMLSCWL